MVELKGAEALRPRVAALSATMVPRGFSRGFKFDDSYHSSSRRNQESLPTGMFDGAVTATATNHPDARRPQPLAPATCTQLPC